MNNDNHSKYSDEEYHFPEDEFIQGEAPSKPQADATLENLEHEAQDARREKIMAIYQKVRDVLSNRIIAAIIAVIIVLLLVHWFTGGSSKQNTAADSAQVVQSTAQPVVSQPNPAVLSQLSEIKQNDSAVHDQVSQLQNALTSLQASVNAISSRHDASDAAIATLAQRVNALQAQQALLMAHAQQGGSVNKTFIKPVYYYIRAMVHNRAWIEGSNGLNSTVTIGSDIRGYGQVTSIDTTNGKVIMNTGKTITFPASDQ